MRPVKSTKQTVKNKMLFSCLMRRFKQNSGIMIEAEGFTYSINKCSLLNAGLCVRLWVPDGKQERRRDTVYAHLDLLFQRERPAAGQQEAICVLSVNGSRVLCAMGLDGKPLNLHWVSWGVSQVRGAECVQQSSTEREWH